MVEQMRIAIIIFNLLLCLSQCLREVSVTMASNDETSLEDLISQINSENHYRVIPKEEYQMLLKCKADSVKQTPSCNPRLPFASADEGARPKFSPRVSLPSPRLFNSTMTSALCQNSNPNPVKLPSFSGSETLQKGDVSFEVWSYEVRCLKSQLSENALLQLVRSSLKGQAREILIPLGEDATIDNILGKLEDFYGNVCTPENIMQNFYADHQKEGETIVTYGSRLEQCISKAVRLGHIDSSAKDAMLRSKFWSGLRSAQLRNATRHKYESVKEFYSLLREVRQIEQEENNLKSVNAVTKPSVSMLTNIDSLTIQNSEFEQMQKQLSDLLGHMKKLDDRMGKLEQNVSSNNYNPQNAYRSDSFQGRQRYYPRGSGNYSQQHRRQFQQQNQSRNQQTKSGNSGQVGGNNLN